MTKSTAAPNWGKFIPVKEIIPYRLIWRSYGPEKVGKSHFGFSAPGPIAVQSFDIGLEGVVEKFVKAGKDIRAISYEFDKDDCTQGAAVAIRDQFIKDFQVALQVARTIIWDTETELWEVFRYAEFDAMSDAPKNYVQLNARYRDLIQQAYDTGVNLQLIQKVKEKWKTVQGTDRNGRPVDKPYPSGEMEPTGFKEAGYIVQANFRHSWEKERGFVIDVLNCRQNMAVSGESFENLEFADIAQLVFPDSTEANWK